MNPEYLKATGESYSPQECEFYGANEKGGLGPNGEDHCHSYVDSREDTKSSR